MSRRDYEVIAGTIRSVWAHEREIESPSHALHILTESLLTALGQNNPRFDEDKFRKACQFPQPNTREEK